MWFLFAIKTSPQSNHNVQIKSATGINIVWLICNEMSVWLLDHWTNGHIPVFFVSLQTTILLPIYLKYYRREGPPHSAKFYHFTLMVRWVNKPHSIKKNICLSIKTFMLCSFFIHFPHADNPFYGHLINCLFGSWNRQMATLRH